MKKRKNTTSNSPMNSTGDDMDLKSLDAGALPPGFNPFSSIGSPLRSPQEWEQPWEAEALAGEDEEGTADAEPYVNEKARLKNAAKERSKGLGKSKAALRQEKNRKLDWVTIESEFRLGQLAVREIARAHGCHETVIRRRAKKYGWTRDLKGRVREAIQDRTIRDDAIEKAGGRRILEESDPDDDAMIVAAAAERGADVIREHRALLNNSKGIIQQLMTELVDASIFASSILDAAKVEAAKGGRGSQSLVRYAEKAVSIHSRAMSANQLSNALKTAITEERKAYNMDGDRDKEDALDQLLSAVRRSDETIASTRQRLDEQQSDHESERWLAGAHFEPKEDELH